MTTVPLTMTIMVFWMSDVDSPTVKLHSASGVAAMTGDDRGKLFEETVFAVLRRLVLKHPGFVEVTPQVEIKLLNDQTKRPDFELVYRIDQEHRELIECQSRERSSSEIAEKISRIKSLSSRNRFVFIFEDIEKLRPEHRRVLESDGVNCLSLEEFRSKIDQIDLVLTQLRRPNVFRRGIQKLTDTWEDLIDALNTDNRNQPPYRGPS